METLSVYEYLPEVFKLASVTWGVEMADTAMLSLLLSAIACLVLTFHISSRAWGAQENHRAFYVGTWCGSVLGCLGFFLAWGMRALELESMLWWADVLALLGIALCMSVIVLFMHRIYESSC